MAANDAIHTTTAPVAAEGEGRRDESRQSWGMHGILLTVDARAGDVRTQETAVVRQVVAALVVVRHLHVAVEEQALGNHQVVRLVAVGRQGLTRPHGEKNRRTRGARPRAAPCADRRHGDRRTDRRRHEHDDESERDRAPHEEDRVSGPREKQIGHAQRNPGQRDQKGQEQRETGSRGQARRRRDRDRASTTSSASSHSRRKHADSPRAVRIGDGQEAERQPDRGARADRCG